MAHLDKYSRADLRRVWKETYREFEDPTKYENAVDISRTKMNYSMRGFKSSYEALRAMDDRMQDIIDTKMNGKAPKLETKIASWVITAPKALQGDDAKVKTFFDKFFKFCEDRYGKENIIDGVVHLDETSPHMTVYIIPECISRKSGKWTISAATRFQRNELRSFHSDFDKVCEAEFGIPNLVTRTDEEKYEDNAHGRSMAEWRRNCFIEEGLMDSFQTMTEEAAETAQQIIEDAKKQAAEAAQQILDEAREQATEIISQARQSQPVEDPAERRKAAMAMAQATKTIRSLKEQIMVMAATPTMSVDDAIVLSGVDDEDYRWHFRDVYDRKHCDKDTPLVAKAKAARDLPDISNVPSPFGMDYQMS